MTKTSDDLRIIRDAAFSAHTGPSIQYGFFTRAGGVSQDLYAGLNCAPVSADDPLRIAENRRRAAMAFGIEPEHLVTLKQTHSALCHIVENSWPAHAATVEGDGLVTDRKGMMIGVLTADCAPVLLAGTGPQGPVIGAAHAGWKGALDGILESTVKAMHSLGALPETVHAVIGPCIAKASYSVGADFKAPFVGRNPQDDRFFTTKEDGFSFDLPAYCIERLLQTGIASVSTTGQDTCSQESDFYSFRRATHRREPDYGRELSAIVISPPVRS